VSQRVSLKFIIVSLFIIIVFIFAGIGFYFLSTELLEKEKAKSNNNFNRTLLEIVAERIEKEIQSIDTKTNDLFQSIISVEDIQVRDWMVDSFFKKSCPECFKVSLYSRNSENYVLDSKYYNKRITKELELFSYLKKDSPISFKEVHETFMSGKLILKALNIRFPRENEQMGNALFVIIVKLQRLSDNKQLVAVVDFDGENFLEILNRAKISSGFLSIVEETRKPLVTLNGETGNIVIGENNLIDAYYKKGSFLPIKLTNITVSIFNRDKSYLTETEKAFLCVISFLITVVFIVAFMIFLYAIKKSRKKRAPALTKNDSEKTKPISSSTNQKTVAAKVNVNAGSSNSKNIPPKTKPDAKKTLPPSVQSVKKTTTLAPPKTNSVTKNPPVFVKEEKKGVSRKPDLKSKSIQKSSIPKDLPEVNAKATKVKLPTGPDFYNSFHRVNTDSETIIEFDENISLLDSSVEIEGDADKNFLDKSLSVDKEEVKISLDKNSNQNEAVELDFEKLKSTDSIEKEAFGITNRTFDDTQTSLSSKKYEPWEQEYSIDKKSGTMKPTYNKAEPENSKKNPENVNRSKENGLKEMNIKKAVIDKNLNDNILKNKIETKNNIVEKKQQEALDDIVVPRPKIKGKNE